MSGDDEWCDVACALEGLAGSSGETAPVQDDWEVLGKNGTPQSRKKVTDITPTVSLEDLAAAPGCKKVTAASDSHPPAALDTSTELTTDGEEEDDDDKMMSSTLTASTSPGSTGGASSVTSSPDRLASAAIRLASQANNAFIHEMDKIFDPDAAYPGGIAVHIPSDKEQQAQAQGHGGVDVVAKNVAKSAQKIVGNLVHQFGQGNTVQQAACGKAPERSTGGGEER